MIPSTTEIWEDFSQELRRFISRRISNPEDADDILQDVFVKIHTHIGSVEDNERLASWLYNIARNTIIDYYRRRRPTLELDESYPAVEDTSSSGDDLAPELASSLRGMINSLPETYRKAIDLSEIQGVKQQAVADKLGISLSGAKSRVQRGRNLLRQEMLDCCHFEFDRRNHPIDYTPRPEYCSKCCN